MQFRLLARTTRGPRVTNALPHTQALHAAEMYLRVFRIPLEVIPDTRTSRKSYASTDQRAVEKIKSAAAGKEAHLPEIVVVWDEMWRGDEFCQPRGRVRPTSAPGTCCNTCHITSDELEVSHDLSLCEWSEPACLTLSLSGESSPLIPRWAVLATTAIAWAAVLWESPLATCRLLCRRGWLLLVRGTDKESRSC